MAIEYRWADNQLDRLPGLAAELVRRQVAVIAMPITRALPAKATTTTTPIVSVAGEDPVTAKTRLSLVLSPASPGRAAT